MPARSVQHAQQTLDSAASELRERVRAAREQIELKKSEREHLQTGYLPRAEQRQRIAEMVDARAAGVADEARTWLAECLRYGGAVGYTELFTYHVASITGMDHTSTVDVGPLMCFLFPDAIKQRLGEVIDQLDFDEGPPASERPAMIQRLDSEIYGLEVAEERLIAESESAGIHISRHPDCDVRAVLEVEEIDS